MKNYSRARLIAAGSVLGALIAAMSYGIANNEAAAARARLRALNGPFDKRLAAFGRLERLGEPGIDILFMLAEDRSPVPLAGNPPAAIAELIPRDSVCDLALDSLRRLRSGNPDAARPFEWSADSGVSYFEALESFRRDELRAALEWWRRERAGDPGSPPAP